MDAILDHSAVFLVIFSDWHGVIGEIVVEEDEVEGVGVVVLVWEDHGCVLTVGGFEGIV